PHVEKPSELHLGYRLGHSYAVTNGLTFRRYAGGGFFRGVCQNGARRLLFWLYCPVVIGHFLNTCCHSIQNKSRLNLILRCQYTCFWYRSHPILPVNRTSGGLVGYFC